MERSEEYEETDTTFRFLFVGIIVIAIFFNFYGIWNDDTVNPYYTAAVTSMVQNIHNFFSTELLILLVLLR